MLSFTPLCIKIERFNHSVPAMRRISVRTILIVFIVLVLGVGLGLAIGWYVWPVTYTEAQPSRMRQDWKDEAVWLTAQAFAYDRDLEAARVRLRSLSPNDPGQLVIDRAKLAIAQRLPPGQITHLARLAAALGARDPAVDAYLSP